jgi:hypothetical protein
MRDVEGAQPKGRGWLTWLLIAALMGASALYHSKPRAYGSGWFGESVDQAREASKRY